MTNLISVSDRLSRSIRCCCPITKRLGCDRFINTRIPVFRESVSDGHTRVTGHVLRLFRRLPFGSSASFLFSWIEVSKKDGIQREGLANIRWRMELKLQRLQWNYFDRVSWEIWKCRFISYVFSLMTRRVREEIFSGTLMAV